MKNMNVIKNDTDSVLFFIAISRDGEDSDYSIKRSYLTVEGRRCVMESKARWQDKLNLGLGFWLILSPLLLVNPYSPIQFDLVTMHSFIMGAIVVIIAGATLLQFKIWEEWVEVVLGVWLVVSPFILGFNHMTVAMVNHILIGLIIAVDSIWVISDMSPATPAT